jgi:hypothetical protein
MTVRKWIFWGTLSILASVVLGSFAVAQDAAAKPKPKPAPAVDDDFGPPVPPLRDDRGPPGRRDFNRPDPQPGNRLGGPPRDGFRGPGPFDQGGLPKGPPSGDPRGGPGRPLGPGGFGPPRWPHAEWGSMEQNDPEMYKLLQSDVNLERQSQELAIQYRQAPQDQREAIKKKLEAVVTEHFEARQQRRLI